MWWFIVFVGIIFFMCKKMGINVFSNDDVFIIDDIVFILSILIIVEERKNIKVKVGEVRVNFGFF